MPIAEKSIIDPDPIKPGVPLKKGTLIGILLIVAVLAVVFALVSANKADNAPKEPEKASGNVQVAGKAKDIDQEVEEAERRRKTKDQNPAMGGADTPPSQSPGGADGSQGAKYSGVQHPTPRTIITPAGQGAKPAPAAGVIDSAARPLSGSGVQQPPGGRNVEDQARSILSKSLAFDEDAPSSRQGLGGANSGVGAAVLQKTSATAGGGNIDRLLEASTNVKLASSGVGSSVDALMGKGKTNEGTDADGSRSFYRDMDKQNQRVMPIKTYSTESHYTLHQGKVIPAVLGRSLNSDVPGEITAYTTLDVYDSLGRGNLLLPKGSVLIGRYASEVKVGQARMMFAFRRLIMPNGQAFDLPAAPGTDMAGAAGVEGDVNNHFLKMFMSSFFVAAVADKVQQPSNVTVIGGGSGSTSPAGQVLADISKTILERNRTIAPTITLEQGTRINIEVVRDMEFPGAYRK